MDEGSPFVCEEALKSKKGSLNYFKKAKWFKVSGSKVKDLEDIIEMKSRIVDS